MKRLYVYFLLLGLLAFTASIGFADSGVKKETKSASVVISKGDVKSVDFDSNADVSVFILSHPYLGRAIDTHVVLEERTLEGLYASLRAPPEALYVLKIRYNKNIA